jgi:hypothetical protein
MARVTAACSMREIMHWLVNVHTPRLCIDGRRASGGLDGLVAEEIINQLVASHGEPEISSDWIDRSRTVLVAHPDQVFSGQWRRYNTKMRVGGSPFYWIWEKHFVSGAAVSVFHRFRPADRLSPSLACETITTVLPPGKIPSLFQTTSRKQRLIVPSQTDKTFLVHQKKISEERIFVIRPAIRRCCVFMDPPVSIAEGGILILTNRGKTRYRNLLAILKRRYPQMPIKMISLKKSWHFTPQPWMRWMRETRLLLYLADRAFDWVTPPLEALFWKIPTVFADGSATLSELLPNSPLRLSTFLIEQPDFETLKANTLAAHERLRDAGSFDPLSYARQYNHVYASLPETV